MKRRLWAFLLAALCLLPQLTGCAPAARPSSENPVTLTIWHVYGSQTKSPFNTAIYEFNNTVGKMEGITVNVVSVTSSSAIDKALAASVNGEPGAEELPDLFTAYPRVAQIVGTERLLAWDQYFSQQELSAFKQEYLQEGYFDARLLMLPVAKSTEALYLNETLFAAFSAQTGVSAEQLQSYEGLFDAANRYFDWSGGKNFIQLNDFYHYALLGTTVHGGQFVRNGELQLHDPAFRTVWTPLARAAIYGGICLDEGYAATRWKTVEIISNVGSTADILYQPEQVIYPDNTTQTIEIISMPYPVFTEDTPVAIHRGGGLFAIRSDDERKNYAAAAFAKWLTEQEHNLSFVTQAGYLPVTDAAFDRLLENPELVEKENYRQLYENAGRMMREYSLYALPVFDGASNAQSFFEESVKLVLKTAHNQYITRVENGEDPETVLHELTDTSFAALQQSFYGAGAKQ